MKLHYLHKNLTHNIGFAIHEKECFLKLWHYHPQLELVYIAQGEGTLYAGDFIGDFQEGDLFLLGRNLPHMFHSSHKANSEALCKALVVHINDQFLSRNFEDLPELAFLSQLQDRAKRGIRYRGSKNKKLLQILYNFEIDRPTKNILYTMQLLSELWERQDYLRLGSSHWLEHFQVTDTKVNDVIEHIMMNFHSEITLERVSEIAGMNKSAFCRYFKKHTGKSFVQFLNEIRVNFSCKLLKETSPTRSISEVCFQSGFNSLSYYNRTFRKVMNIPPGQYQKGQPEALKAL